MGLSEKLLFRRTIADRVKVVRGSSGLSQKEFAYSIGVNYLTYRGYENCRSDIPIYILVRISHAFGISMDFLTGSAIRVVLHP